MHIRQPSYTPPAQPRFGKHFEVDVDPEYFQHLPPQSLPLDQTATLGAAFVEYIARKWAAQNDVHPADIDEKKPDDHWGNMMTGKIFAKVFKEPEGLHNLLAYVARGPKLHIFSGSKEMDGIVKEALDEARLTPPTDKGTTAETGRGDADDDKPSEFESSLWGPDGPPDFGSSFEHQYDDKDYGAKGGEKEEKWDTGIPDEENAFSQYEAKFNPKALPYAAKYMNLDENSIPLQGVPFSVDYHKDVPVVGEQEVLRLFHKAQHDMQF